MKHITIADCDELKEKFDRYCETAEPSEYPLLLILDVKFTQTVNFYREAGKIENQENANAMFRVVLRVIGEDFSEYEVA